MCEEEELKKALARIEELETLMIEFEELLYKFYELISRGKKDIDRKLIA